MIPTKNMIDPIENKIFEEIQIGDEASIVRQLSKSDIIQFAELSGDTNPAHFDTEFARDQRFRDVVAHGMWTGTLISAVLGTKLPGPGTIYIGQNLDFLEPVYPGDVVTTRVVVQQKTSKGRRVILLCECKKQGGALVVSGEAVVKAPKTKVRCSSKNLPALLLDN